MKKTLLLFTLILLNQLLMAQCPYFKGVMIDACNSTGFEGDNEFMVLKNGTSAVKPADFTIYYGSLNPPSSGTTSQKITFNHLTGTYTAAMNTFIAGLNTTAANAGCANLVSTSIPTSGVPANATFLVFSPLVSQNYDLSSLCGSAPLYILFDTYYNADTACKTSTGVSVGPPAGTSYVGFNRCGTFKNFGVSATNNFRYFSVQTNATGGNCPAAIVSYNYTLLPQQATDTLYDGGFVSWVNQVATYTNTGCSTVVVPVILKNFYAVHDNKFAYLQWQTATEINTLSFDIERSYDGNHFTRIQTVAAAGFSSDLKSYSYKDPITRTGIIYYRLKLNDADGKSSYSSLAKINPVKKEDFALTVYPKPTSDYIHLEWNALTNADYTISILDITGRVLSTRIIPALIGFNQQTIPVSNLQDGQYIIKLNSKDYEGTVRFTKD